jgi:hypothetical protein
VIPVQSQLARGCEVAALLGTEHLCWCRPGGEFG